MSRKNKLSLVAQVECALKDKLAIGQSKHADKLKGNTLGKIYSWNTFKSYMKHANYFVAYCKQQHKCKNLDECRPYVNEWIQSRMELSAYTQKLEASALAKLYGCNTTDFIKTKTRNRADITRSRGEKKRDTHFSESNHKELVAFCKATGLRRSELKALTGDKLKFVNKTAYIVVDSASKGGRYREAPVIGDIDNVLKLMRSANKRKVFNVVPNGADIHGYRAEYATEIYNSCARQIDEIPYDSIHKGTKKSYQSEVYHCRGDRKGKHLDKLAMLKVSNALGHNRISVVGEHYLRIE